MTTYKIVKVMRRTGNKITQSRGHSLEEAQAIIQTDIAAGTSTAKSMLVFYKE